MNPTCTTTACITRGDLTGTCCVVTEHSVTFGPALSGVQRGDSLFGGGLGVSPRILFPLPEESVMKVVYDQEVDVLRNVFNTAAIEESDEENPGVILDYDSDGNLVGLEVLEASKRVEDPRALDYAVTG